MPGPCPGCYVVRCSGSPAPSRRSIACSGGAPPGSDSALRRGEVLAPVQAAVAIAVLAAELVAEAGVLLMRATQIVDKGSTRRVGVDGGMNTLLRPALYNAWHQIVNLSRLDEAPTDLVDIVGPICESGDVLARRRRLPPTQEGDVVLAATAGAYGHAMASSYNLRAPAEELVLQ